jgi:hypothetical protein
MVGYDKPVEVGQLNVHQDKIGASVPCLGDGLGPVTSLTDDNESLRLQHRPGGTAEVFMVVDDQHRRSHAPIMADDPNGRIVGSTSPVRPPTQSRQRSMTSRRRS